MHSAWASQAMRMFLCIATTNVLYRTGMRCLPASDPVLLANGRVLHDWHAEVIALRAFNHFLLQEAKILATSPGLESNVLRHRAPDEIVQCSEQQPFVIREDLRIMMYCSEAPCGDASMELIMEAQEDATPWPVTSHDDPALLQLLGRGSFSQLGIVRRKPCKFAIVSNKKWDG